MPFHVLSLVLALSLWDEASDLLEKARLAGDAGQFDKADGFYRKILEVAPSSAAAEVARERLQPNAILRVQTLEENGDPKNRIDLFVLGDGYTREKKFQKLFDQGARETLKYFAQAPVYRRYRTYFNFHAMNVASHEDGVDARGKDYDTALGAFESGASQGQVAVDHQRVNEFLSKDPRAEGFAVVLVRLGTLGTGGGGVAVCGGVPSNTVIHEFGHAFGNLLDEYTSDVGYTGPVPRGYNVANDPDPAKAPWKHWLDAKTNGIGMFPGAAGRSQGAWRGSASGCAMSSGPSYCLICREAITAHVYDVVSPIDDATPHHDVLLAEKGRPVVIEVVPMEPVGSPKLEVTFTIEATQDRFERGSVLDLDRPLGTAPSTGTDEWGFDDGLGSASGGFGGYYAWDRPSRFGKAPEPALKGAPLRVARVRGPDKRTAYQVEIDASNLDAGNYYVRTVVTDPTDWVIKPEWLPLLSDSRTWRVQVMK